MILGAVAKLSTHEVAPEVRKMLFVLKGEMTRKEIQQKLGLKDEKHFRTTYQQPAIVQGIIEVTKNRCGTGQQSKVGLSFVLN